MIDLDLSDNRTARVLSIAPDGVVVFQLRDQTGRPLVRPHSTAQLADWPACERAEIGEDAVTLHTTDPETGAQSQQTLDAAELEGMLDAALEPSLAMAQARREAEIVAEYEAIHAQGYDTGLGWRMPYHALDRAAYHQRQKLTEVALDRGVIAPSAPVVLADVDGLPHSVAAGDVADVLFAYGVAYDALWVRLPAAREAIANATTPAAVEAVEL